MASLFGRFFRRVTKGKALNVLVSLYNMNRIFNVLEDIQGVGLRIEKPTNSEGLGWRIINDGTSDTKPPEGFEIAGGGGEGGTAHFVEVTSDEGLYFEGYEIVARESGGSQQQSIKVYVPLYNMVNNLPSGTQAIAFEVKADAVGGWTDAE